MKKKSFLFAFVIANFFIVSACVPTTPLIKASKAGDSSAIEQLVDEGVNINEPDSRGYTPLMYAVWSGKTETVKILIDKGADLNAKDKNGYTALLWASSYGYYNIANLLIVKNAYINARGNDGATAYSLAAENNNSELLKLLESKGADKKVGDKRLLNAASSVCSERNPKSTLDAIRHLIKSGADINVKGTDGETVLDLVLCSMDIDIIHNLINSGANLWVPEKGKARIFFVGTELVLNYSTVWVGKKYKTLNINTSEGLAFYDVEPGKHTHYSSPFRSTIEVKEGNTYYFKITQKRNFAAEVVGALVFSPANLLKTTVEVTSFPEAEAKQAIKKMLKLEELK